MRKPSPVEVSNWPKVTVLNSVRRLLIRSASYPGLDHLLRIRSLSPCRCAPRFRDSPWPCDVLYSSASSQPALDHPPVGGSRRRPMEAKRARGELIPRTGRQRVALAVTQKQKFCFVRRGLLVGLCSAGHRVSGDRGMRK